MEDPCEHKYPTATKIYSSKKLRIKYVRRQASYCTPLHYPSLRCCCRYHRDQGRSRKPLRPGFFLARRRTHPSACGFVSDFLFGELSELLADNWLWTRPQRPGICVHVLLSINKHHKSIINTYAVLHKISRTISLWHPPWSAHSRRDFTGGGTTMTWVASFTG